MYESGEISSFLPSLYRLLEKFANVSREEFDILIPYLELHTFDKKSTILRPGEQENYISVVVEGLVRKFVMKDRQEVTLQLAVEGHFIHSEISYHYRIPSYVGIESVERSKLISIHYENIQTILRKWPGAERVGRLLITHMFLKKEQHHHALIRFTTRERFLAYYEHHPDLVQRVPQKILASYLRIKPETFSRLKHLLKQHPKHELLTPES